MRMHGIEMARDTDQQALEGAAVALDPGFTQLRKGDLLYFRPTASADGPERITHVGIYVGNMEFIHASGLVRRNSFDPASPIYSENLLKRLARVRRVLP
jgi:cell wall-associated NlpC family hydrolase